MKSLDTKLFAKLINSDEKLLPTGCLELLKEIDFSFTQLNQKDRDQVILDILKTIDLKKSDKSGATRIGKWEAGWSENLELFRKDPNNLSNLKPLYYRPTNIIRLGNEYVYSNNENIEYNLFKLIREWILETIILPCQPKAVWEFGCGPAHNLVHFAQKLKNTRLVGLDWALSSQKIINLIKSKFNYNIQGYQFDFLTLIKLRKKKLICL